MNGSFFLFLLCGFVVLWFCGSVALDNIGEHDNDDDDDDDDDDDGNYNGNENGNDSEDGMTIGMAIKTAMTMAMTMTIHDLPTFRLTVLCNSHSQTSDADSQFSILSSLFSDPDSPIPILSSLFSVFDSHYNEHQSSILPSFFSSMILLSFLLSFLPLNEHSNLLIRAN